MKLASVAALAILLTVISQVTDSQGVTLRNCQIQEVSKDKTAIEWIKVLAKNPKDEAALKGIRSLDPSQFPTLLRLAADVPGPAAYCTVATLVKDAMRASLNASIDDLYKEYVAKKAEWKKDETLFSKHTRALLVRANYLADLVVLYSHKSMQSGVLWKLAEILAIETDPHPVHLYGSLAQCKVASIFGADSDRDRRELAAYCLEDLDKAKAKSDMAEKLKECDVEDLRSSFEKLVK